MLRCCFFKRAVIDMSTLGGRREDEAVAVPTVSIPTILEHTAHIRSQWKLAPRCRGVFPPHHLKIDNDH